MFFEFPKWKYSGSIARLVEHAEEELGLGDGWHDTPVAAADAAATQVKQEADDTNKAVPDLDTLRVTATSLGITVDGRWGTQRLEDDIKAKILADGPLVPDEADAVDPAAPAEPIVPAATEG